MVWTAVRGVLVGQAGAVASTGGSFDPDAPEVPWTKLVGLSTTNVRQVLRVQ